MPALTYPIKITLAEMRASRRGRPANLLYRLQVLALDQDQRRSPTVRRKLFMSATPQQAKEKRSAHRTQWAAQFAVASELCKRGYEVAFTMGNATPLADLMVVSPTSKRSFLIDVKGLYKPNPWVIKEKATRDSLFYVLAFVPDETVNRFFILSQKQVNTYIGTELARLGRPDNYSMTGILWKQAEAHENRWDMLPK
jgi:hypothetical protein